MTHPAIHQFDPEIYPRLLWVYFGPYSADITGRFKVRNPEHIPDSLAENIATTCLAQDLVSERHGVLVFALKKSDITPGVIAHESVHVADAFFQELSMFSQSFDASNEPYAYLVGWAAKCINEARIHKNEKKLAK